MPKPSLPASAPHPTPASDDPLLTAREGAAEVRLSLPAFWRGVRDGRFPAPVYPAARAPRWVRSELRAAVMRTRMLPTEAVAARRAKKQHRVTHEMSA
ncbi:hypothetical protein M0638_20475 [Roseomonas sp. NAR14]|uniref:AlpA family transcriptional regulator n=1 Tax=Roseomonas acroporae TaxID=2937791 RepID=A0A9X1YID2_9PROT|nr:hypothetical protein [Roseomonas acroporae]MCK8786751.1 hypothetical protein [Roseomonas acroporae]